LESIGVNVMDKDWNGQFKINDFYRPIAEALTRKFGEIGHVIPNSILFLDDTTGSGKTLNDRKIAQVGVIPGRWREIIRQLTGRTFEYCMIFYKKNIHDFSKEQIVATVYHELRHIGRDGNLVHHNVEDWAEMIAHLGPAWNTTYNAIPDLLDPEIIDWDSIIQPTLFPEDRLLKAVR
jgi:hypothetical protein